MSLGTALFCPNLKTHTPTAHKGQNSKTIQTINVAPSAVLVTAHMAAVGGFACIPTRCSEGGAVRFVYAKLHASRPDDPLPPKRTLFVANIPHWLTVGLLRSS